MWKFACVTSPAVSEIYSDLCVLRAKRVIIDLRQRRRRCRSCCERYPRSRVLAADGDARCQRFLADNYATGSGCSGTRDCLKSRGTSRSRSSEIFTRFDSSHRDSRSSVSCCARDSGCRASSNSRGSRSC